MKGTITIKILEPINTGIEISIEKPVDPSEFFKTSDDFYVSSDFTNHIIAKATKVEQDTKYSVDSWSLETRSDDAQIEQALESRTFEESEVCAVIADLISKQPKGKEGILQNNGYSNLFYTKDFVVYVFWSADGGYWSVHAWYRGGGAWRVSYRVFSPAN